MISISLASLRAITYYYGWRHAHIEIPSQAIRPFYWSFPCLWQPKQQPGTESALKPANRLHNASLIDQFSSASALSSIKRFTSIVAVFVFRLFVM